MNVNCAEGKGIKFIRDELKFFAKTNIHNCNGSVVKSIILLNADFLTIDAQSALRRCIELFSTYTRFFIVIENKEALIKPILSRFCSIYVYRPLLKKKVKNIHSIYNIKIPKTFYRKKYLAIREIFETCEANSQHNIFQDCYKLYEKGASGIDLIEYIDKHLDDSREKYDLLVYLDIIKREIRNEVLLMFFIINQYKMRNKSYLENMDIL